MAKVETHPTDEGKFQSTLDNYGHGPGNGKSRNAVYKHLKKVAESSETESVKIDTNPSSEDSDIAQNQDFLDNEESTESEWGSVEWDSEDEGEVNARTIPIGIAGMAEAQGMTLEAQGRMVRYGYVALDRMLTHWGRAVMNQPDWEVERHPGDYDALESSTIAVMAHYGIQIPVSPLMVFGATLTSAYGPPVMHIRKNADPNRKRRGIFSRLFRRKKKTKDGEHSDFIP